MFELDLFDELDKRISNLNDFYTLPSSKVPRSDARLISAKTFGSGFSHPTEGKFEKAN